MERPEVTVDPPPLLPSALILTTPQMQLEVLAATGGTAALEASPAAMAGMAETAGPPARPQIRRHLLPARLLLRMLSAVLAEAAEVVVRALRTTALPAQMEP